MSNAFISLVARPSDGQRTATNVRVRHECKRNICLASASSLAIQLRQNVTPEFFGGSWSRVLSAFCILRYPSAHRAIAYLPTITLPSIAFVYSHIYGGPYIWGGNA